MQLLEVSEYLSHFFVSVFPVFFVFSFFFSWFFWVLIQYPFHVVLIFSKFFNDGFLSFKTTNQLLFCHFLGKLASELLQVGSMVNCSMLDYLRDGTANVLHIRFLLKMFSNILFKVVQRGLEGVLEW